jgi:excisionase family DNA binding protein
MSVAPDRLFYSVKDAAEILGVASSTVGEAIRAGRIKAIKVGVTLEGARIPRTELFPADDSATDLRTRRLRKLVLEARDKREAADRLKAEWQDAERTADEALRAIEHELALDEIEAASDRTRRALIAD